MAAELLPLAVDGCIEEVRRALKLIGAMVPCDNKECPAWDCGVCSSYLGAKCEERQQ